MASGKYISLLESVGLTKNEAIIYLHLLDKTEGSPISEVVESCDISKADAKSALVTLLGKGFVKIESNKVTAVPPEMSLFAALQSMEKRFESEIRRAREAVTMLQKPLQAMYWEKRVGIRPEELLEPLEDLESMERMTAQMISQAQESIFIFTETFGWYGHVRKQILSSLKRGVEAKVLMIGVDEGSLARARELEQLGVEVRRYTGEWYPVRGTLVDNRTLLFLIWATRKDIERPISFRPHYTKNSGLIRVFADSFQRRWDEGKPLPTQTLP